MLTFRIVPKLELIMRFTSVGGAASLALVSISTSLSGQRADYRVDARSIALLTEGKAVRAAGDLDRATDLLETSVAVDPRNRDAFVIMAELARERGLPGKAIRLYREALLLEPNDMTALQGQGAALVAKGAVERAKQNLSRIRMLCKAACAPAIVLAAAIAKGPPITTAQATTLKPPTADE